MVAAMTVPRARVQRPLLSFYGIYMGEHLPIPRIGLHASGSTQLSDRREVTRS